MASNLIIWNNLDVSNPWGGNLMNTVSNIITINDTKSSVLPIFDARVMNQAISESGGEATDDANLGAVHYMYDDAVNNDFKVSLPYG